MDERLRELLERMTAPGQFPQISASEGHEVVEGCTALEQENANLWAELAVTKRELREKMRKVKVRIWDADTRKWVDDICGAFHKWGDAYEQFEAGPGNYTIAIVELPGGRIVTALPEYVVFLDGD